MNLVLAATDLPPGVDHALERAIILAERLRCDVIAVHVVGGPVDDPRGVAADRVLSERLRALGGQSTVQLTHRVLFGHEGQAITAEAQVHGADLIVLGPHRHGLLRDLFGTATVEQVMARPVCSVLVAATSPARDYRRVLVGVDFSHHSRRALDEAMRLFPGSDLRLVHAYDVPFGGFLTGEATGEEVRSDEADALDQLLSSHERSFFDAARWQFRDRCVLRQGETVSAIAQEVNDAGADLLVLGTHGQGGMLSGAVGSVARAFLKDPPCDVLAVHSR